MDFRNEKPSFCVFPVVPDVLDVFVVLEHVEHLLHVLRVVLVRQLDIAVLRQHLDLRGEQRVALGRQRVGDGSDLVLGGVDVEYELLGLKIGGARVERVHHDGVLVQLLVLVVDDDDALAVEGPGDAVCRAHVPAVLVEVVADLAGGAVAVIGHGLDDDGDALRAVAFVGDLLVVFGVARAERLVDRALDIVIGHVGRLGLGDHGRKLGVAAGVAAAAFLDRDYHFARDLGEGLRALGVGRALGFLYVVPLGMS